MRIDQEYEEYLRQYELSADQYTYAEGLAVAVAHEIIDGSFAFIGTGLPLLAAGLAQRTHAENMTMILEVGVVGSQIEHMPRSISDPRASYRAAFSGTLVDAFGTIAARGYCTLGILGAAECDKYGNLNATSMGAYWPAGVSESGRGPAVRLAGAGGSSSVAALADRTISMMVHERRRFPEQVQYLTAPAGMRGPKGEDRFSYGLYRGGDTVVVTDLCKMRPDPETGVLYVTDLFPGVTERQIKENTGWDVDVSRAKPMPEPTEEELRILRMEVDPARLYLGRKKKG